MHSKKKVPHFGKGAGRCMYADQLRRMHPWIRWSNFSALKVPNRTRINSTCTTPPHTHQDSAPQTSRCCTRLFCQTGCTWGTFEESVGSAPDDFGTPPSTFPREKRMPPVLLSPPACQCIMSWCGSKKKGGGTHHRRVVSTKHLVPSNGARFQEASPDLKFPPSSIVVGGESP